MNGLDIGTIILCCITLVSTIVNGIISISKKNQEKDSKNDEKQWEVIDKLIQGMMNKQEQICKTLTKLFKRVKEIEK